MAKPDVDIAVVGGGITGMLCAALSAQAGFSVAIVEASAAPPSPPGEEYDLRTYALTRASARVLASARVWHRITSRRAAAFRRMEVWDAAGTGRVHYDAAELCEPALGYVVEHAVLVHALEEVLAAAPRVLVTRGRRVQAVLRQGELQRLSLDDHRMLTAQVIVGADGAHSTLRQLLDLSVVTDDYGQSALLANVRTEQPHEACARQRFLPGGPLALLPLTDPHRCSIVWSTARAEAERLASCPEETFLAALAEASGHCLGAIRETSARLRFPLVHQHLETYVVSGVAFVGDAAHVIHPLAGQGLNLGILDAAALVEVLGAAEARGGPLGARRVLRRYERWRKGENLLMEWTTDGLNKLFGSGNPWIIRLRNEGLALTDRMPPVKRWIMARASGLSGDLPRVARDVYSGV
jgi:2-octaprenylphenol hydroxylase